MTNNCKTCPVSTGTHKPAEALHQIAEPQPTALGYADAISAGLSYTAPHILALAADELRAQHARIAELESQLEAIGAGGVEPLRKQAAAQQAVQAAYPHLPHSVADVVDFMDGRGVNVDFSHPAPAGGTSLYTAAQMRAYVDADRAQRAATSPEIVKLDRGFRWDSEKQHHVPTLLIEFTPVPANSPNTEKGWADRDALAAALAAPAHPSEGVPAQSYVADFFREKGFYPSLAQAFAAGVAHAAATQPAAQGMDAQQYRLIERGELIEAGDQFLRDDFTWQIDPRGIFVGVPYGAALRPARRALAAQAKQGGA